MIREWWRENVLSAEERAAIDSLENTLGYDIVRTYRFWEVVIARMVSGRLTDHSCPWDVEIVEAHEHNPIRIEVKYSNEHETDFGAAGTRRVMKFANPKGSGAMKQADVIAFVGIDATDALFAWVTPASMVRQSASITMTSPRDRVGTDRGPLGMWLVPFDQMLPAVLSAARLHRGETSIANALPGLDSIDLNSTTLDGL